MKIILVGEYSRLHNSLKEGLIKNGHEVLLIGNGDSFKQYPIDINTDARFIKNNFLLNKARHLIHKITKFDIAAIETTIRFNRYKELLKDNDVVQLINESPFSIGYHSEKRLLKFLFENNKNVFLSACGDDYKSISYYLKDELKYHILTPYLENKNLSKRFQYSLQYTTPLYKKLHEYVYHNVKGVIPSDIDYVFPLKDEPLAKSLIPNPINTDIIAYSPIEINDKIVIFHGINKEGALKKGNQYFTDALEIIKQKYPEKVEIITTYSLPYNEYLKQYKKAHILLDQVFAYDQGYNALEAMAAGKVVFTGAEKEFMDHYGLKEPVAINALPDVKDIAKNLEKLILNPEEIVAISKRARKFIEKHHYYIKVAQKYMDTWMNS
ncbi:glycosyltransferase [Aquimarina sp. MMG016]|uniref:glycosyltransferase family protein n=1 Tax=Aquimarina sp. MMG016 TaxID=2822690 RepID=UPI001B3A082E|nr:glycosyltransferase [Aquimarina sp. MMG016]MBQ4822199.1 glycosyltransferase [Aquimarina sp. MMG016]